MKRSPSLEAIWRFCHERKQHTRSFEARRREEMPLLPLYDTENATKQIKTNQDHTKKPFAQPKTLGDEKTPIIYEEYGTRVEIKYEVTAEKASQPVVRENEPPNLTDGNYLPHKEALKRNSPPSPNSPPKEYSALRKGLWYITETMKAFCIGFLRLAPEPEVEDRIWTMMERQTSTPTTSCPLFCMDFRET